MHHQITLQHINRLLEEICRINLDAFWGRASSTVSRNRNRIEEGIKTLSSLGLKGPYQTKGKMPTTDFCGYGIAIKIVMASLNLGKHSKHYTQFKSIRKIQLAYSNWYKSTGDYESEARHIINDRGVSQKIRMNPHHLYGS